MPPPNSPPPPPPPSGGDPPEGEITRFLNRLRAGDKSVLNPLLEHTYSRFRSFAQMQLRGYPVLRGELETDDVLNQLVLDLKEELQNRSSRSPDSSKHFLNFAARVMRHKLIDLARRRRPAAESDLDRLPGARTGPEDLAQRSEVHEAVEKLDERLRQVVELLFYQGLTQAAAAVELNVNEKTVQRDWAKALVRLNGYLNGGGNR